jgi:hypothetical protein
MLYVLGRRGIIWIFYTNNVETINNKQINDKSTVEKTQFFIWLYDTTTTDVNLDCNIAYVDLCTTHKESFAVGSVSKS